jgi:TetR/AcrR family transcriptional regulator, cholesterol catabolism regulator
LTTPLDTEVQGGVPEPSWKESKISQMEGDQTAQEDRLGVRSWVKPKVVSSRKSTPPIETIQDVAAVLFQTKGYQNVTMDDIANELGITKPTLYVHVGRKTTILEGIFERVLREGEEMLAQAEALPVASERLRALILNWTIAATSRNQAHYRVFAAHMPELSRSSARYFLRWSAEVVDRVRTMVVDGQRAGIIRPEIDPIVLAYSVLAVPNWTARWFRPDGRLTAEEIASQQWTLLWSGMAVSAEDLNAVGM